MFGRGSLDSMGSPLSADVVDQHARATGGRLISLIGVGSAKKTLWKGRTGSSENDSSRGESSGVHSRSGSGVRDAAEKAATRRASGPVSGDTVDCVGTGHSSQKGISWATGQNRTVFVPSRHARDEGGAVLRSQDTSDEFEFSEEAVRDALSDRSRSSDHAAAVVSEAGEGEGQGEGDAVPLHSTASPGSATSRYSTLSETAYSEALSVYDMDTLALGDEEDLEAITTLDMALEALRKRNEQLRALRASNAALLSDNASLTRRVRNLTVLLEAAAPTTAQKVAADDPEAATLSSLAVQPPVAANGGVPGTAATNSVLPSTPGSAVALKRTVTVQDTNTETGGAHRPRRGTMLPLELPGAPPSQLIDLMNTVNELVLQGRVTAGARSKLNNNIVLGTAPDIDRVVSTIELAQQLPPGLKLYEDDVVAAVVPSGGEQSDVDPAELETVRKLSEGFYGEVFLCRHESSGREVVVKRIKTKGPGAQSMFVREVRLLKALVHPNVLECVGFFVEGEELNIVTAYIDGGSLEDMLHKAKVSLTWSRILAITTDIARGIAYLHSREIIHRDLKSGNCLVYNDSGIVVICDMGLARCLPLLAQQQGLKRMMSQAGSWFCQGPELLNGEEYDSKCDVFSFGLLLAELLMRCEPWELPRTNQFGLEVDKLRESITSGTSLNVTSKPTEADIVERLISMADRACKVNSAERPTFSKLETELLDVVGMHIASEYYAVRPQPDTANIPTQNSELEAWISNRSMRARSL